MSHKPGRGIDSSPSTSPDKCHYPGSIDMISPDNADPGPGLTPEKLPG